MKLYELTNQYQQIFDTIDEEGEINESSITLIDDLQEDFAKKAIAVASYIKNLEAEAVAINNAIQDMKSRQNKIENKMQSLSAYLQMNLQAMNITEIKDSPYFKIKLKTCPPSVQVLDEAIIPVDYWNEKVTVALDKTRIKQDIGAGFDIPGVALHRNIKLEIK